MKKLKEPKSQPSSSELVFLIEEDPDGGYTARALGESIFTQAETMEALAEEIRDAVHCHYDRPETRPSVVRLHFVKDTVIVP